MAITAKDLRDGCAVLTQIEKHQNNPKTDGKMVEMMLKQATLHNASVHDRQL